MRRTVDTLPAYLRKYCVEQTGDKYTSRDHAAWRYIMRQSRAFFKTNAVPIYLEGLKRTGINLDRIPLISEMDAKLQELGWGAVPVCGFIPPAAFLDFQARRVLPIAYDMRSVDHIAYTPAPDIVHEAAGHAPIIADESYREYLTMYAAMAQKAIFSKEDMDLYEAIRALSDIKENPDSTRAMIDDAEQALKTATASVSFISEANKVARMNWWTVEYGLLGSLSQPKIYGAGLLSSVGESQTCLSSKVKKIRLTVDCTNTSYNITEPQPQLFVADDISHLCSTLKEFEATLAFKRGGAHGLTEAKRCRTVTTVVLDSGLEMSGVVTEFALEQGSNKPEFLKFEGPVQLATDGEEIPGQGAVQHHTGFSSPLGTWLGKSGDPSRFSDKDLSELGIAPGRRTKLKFTSGFEVEGQVALTERKAGRLVVVKWVDCRVTRAGKTYFLPEWGDFDMAVGAQVTSVFGGPADRVRYGSHDVGQATTTPGRTSPFSRDELLAFEAYAELRQRRQDKKTPFASQLEWAKGVARRFPDEWLLKLELIELLRGTSGALGGARDIEALRSELKGMGERLQGEKRWLVEQGLALDSVPD